MAVKIEEVNVANKKLVLSMKNNRADVSAYTGVASDKWLQAIVQKVTDFGLFARPAGFDTAGRCCLLHYLFWLNFFWIS